jgi:predicted dehydrogenase
MAVSVVPLERQFLNFADSISNGRKPLVSGEQGLAALQIVEAIYDACRTRQRIVLEN